MITINYEIKINKGDFKDKTIEIAVDIDRFEYNSLIDILIEEDYLDSYSNNNEFNVLKTYIK